MTENKLHRIGAKGNIAGEWRVDDVVIPKTKNHYRDNPPVEVVTDLYEKLYEMFDSDLYAGRYKKDYINVSEIARAAGREL